jgi:hypothetical protein
VTFEEPTEARDDDALSAKAVVQGFRIMGEKAMSDRHDWFAEVAESFVRYLFALHGFEVFGQSEWGADLAVRDRESGDWLRCEVRSSDTGRKPSRKKPKKLEGRAELLAQVTANPDAMYTLRVSIKRLNANGTVDTSVVPWSSDVKMSLRRWISVPAQQGCCSV